MLLSIENFLQALGPWALILFFAYLCIESSAFVGLFIPADVVVVFVGALAGQHLYSPASAILVVVGGTTLGDLIGFLIGRRWGRPLVARWPWLRRRYENYRRDMESHLRNWTVATILFTRLSGIGHSFVPFVCGMSRLNLFHYTAASLASETVWGGGLAIVGYMLGRHWRVVNQWLESVGGGLLSLVLLLVIFMMARRWFHRSRREF